jgi:hypothetical protein
MVLAGSPSAAYDIVAHHAIEWAAAPDVGIMPFPYPPPFLMIVTPFALVSFPIAFILWGVITAGLYALAGRRVAPLAFVLANPPIIVALMIGQSSLLTGAIFIYGLTLVTTAPLAAGMVLGLLIIKPQLALMLPIAMIAGRQWRVIAGAMISAVSVLVVALILFGPAAYRGFFDILPNYVGYMRQGSWDWAELASTFALARYFELSPWVAWAIQLIAAVSAATITAIAWSRDWSEKIAILAAASLLASGYLFTYDAVLLIVPAGILISQARFRTLGLLWLLCALPVVHFYKLYDGPNTIPLACLFSLALMAAPHLKRSGARPAPAQSVAA